MKKILWISTFLLIDFYFSYNIGILHEKNIYFEEFIINFIINTIQLSLLIIGFFIAYETLIEHRKRNRNELSPHIGFSDNQENSELNYDIENDYFTNDKDVIKFKFKIKNHGKYKTELKIINMKYGYFVDEYNEGLNEKKLKVQDFFTNTYEFNKNILFGGEEGIITGYFLKEEFIDEFIFSCIYIDCKAKCNEIEEKIRYTIMLTKADNNIKLTATKIEIF